MMCIIQKISRYAVQLGVFFLILSLPIVLLADSSEWVVESSKDNDAFFTTQSGSIAKDDEFYFIHTKKNCDMAGIFFRFITVPKVNKQILKLKDKIIPVYIDDYYYEAVLADIDPIIKSNITVAYYATFYLGIAQNEKIMDNFNEIEKLLIQLANPSEAEKYDSSRLDSIKSDIKLDEYFTKMHETWDFKNLIIALNLSIRNCSNNSNYLSL